MNSFCRPFGLRCTSLSLFCALSILALQAKEYRRIVSLAPSITQSIYYVGAKERLIGCTSYCKIPASEGIQVVASAVKPNVEKIASLKPDLVLTANFTSIKDIEALRKLGIEVVVLSSPKSFEEICSQFVRVGTLLGHAKEAERIVSESKAKVKAIGQRIPKSRKPNLFFQIGASPLFTVVPGNFMCDYARYSGGTNIAADLKNGRVGREFVVARNPDYIFIVTMGILGEQERKAWYKFENMKATQARHIFVLDSNVACLPTPITFVNTLEIITQHIYK